MINIALVGHIDHGKSTLIGRLLYDTNSLPEGKIEEIKKTCESLEKKFEFAYLVDALEEERKNQMTIETAQVFFRSKKREYALIDAPGHKEFLKNMITGVSEADAAILLIDVKEGVQGQTKRHAYLLSFLGIDKIIVAINKIDLVNYEEKEFLKIKSTIEAYLDTLKIKPLVVVPISAYFGDNVVKRSKNMKWYSGPTLIEALDSVEEAKEFGSTVFVVQDVFEGKITGNLLFGKLERNADYVVLPRKEKLKIKKIFYGSTDLQYTTAPKALGLETESKLLRGEIITSNPDEFSVSDKADSLVFVLQNKLDEGENYKIKIFTQEVPCKVKIREKINIENLEKISSSSLKESDAGAITILADRPIVISKHVPELKRFVIEKDGKIIAGGKFL